jgi:uroporphyrinogen-III decarboxylase
MKNSKFIKALNLQENSIPPVWFMRQAGRIPAGISRN